MLYSFLMKAVKSESTSFFVTSKPEEVSSWIRVCVEQQNIWFDSFARAVASFNVVLMQSAFTVTPASFSKILNLKWLIQFPLKYVKYTLFIFHFQQDKELNVVIMLHLVSFNLSPLAIQLCSLQVLNMVHIAVSNNTFSQTAHIFELVTCIHFK